MFTSQPVLLPAVLVVADVLDVLRHVPAQSVLPHDRQHLPVHQVMRPEAVGITTIPSREVFADVQPFTGWVLVTDRSSPFSLVTFAYLQKREQQPETKHFACHTFIKESSTVRTFQKQAAIYQRKKKCMHIPQSFMNYIHLIIPWGQKRPEDSLKET